MAKLRGDNRKLSGGQKAAVFMLALGPEYSSKIFEKMDDEEIRELSQTMSTVGSVESDTVEGLFAEFADQLSEGGGNVTGSVDSTERHLRKSLSEERVNTIMEEIGGPQGRTMWDKLDNVNQLVLANYFKNEYPQTVAVVLSKLKPDHASNVLALLPENFAMEVIMRMLRMETVQKEVLDNVERTLRTEFMTNLNRTAKRDSHEMMAEIFNALDRNTENQFMSSLEERSQESAEKIKSLMFTFDDLASVNAAGIQVILRQVEKDQLAMALKGGSDDVKDLFFSNMSQRAGKMMKEDMEAMGAVRLRDVDDAQSAIVQTSKALADSGEIMIATGGDDDEFVT